MHHEYFTTTTGNVLYDGNYCQSDVDNAVEPQVTAGMALRAFQRVPIAAADTSIAPVGNRTLVNIPTIFWTEAEPFRRTVQLLGKRVDLDITPATYTWVYDDGATDTSDDPGTPYRDTLAPDSDLYQSHDYTHRATVRPHVDVTWSARWRVDGGPWRPVDGTVTIAGTPTDLTVLTARPRLVG